MDTQERPGLLSPWDLLAAAGVAALSAFYAWVLPLLPDPVPTHFSSAGQANGWTPKAQLPWLIFGLPVLIWIVLLITGGLISLSQQDPAKARVAAVQPLRGFLGLGGAILMAGCLSIPVYGMDAIQLGVGCFFGCLILGIVFMVREAKVLLSAQSDAQNYRWGIFYVNPEDPRLWVEKRLGVGWTLNYARPAAYWMTLLLLLPIPLVLVLVRLLAK